MRTLQLAGDSLEDLLEQVHREHGDRARIVEANKCRSGGIAGFFARETFEVVVELDDESDPATAPPTATVVDGPAPASILDLADAVNDRERAATASPSSTPRPAVVTEAAPVSTETEAFAALLARLARDVDPAAAERLLETDAPTPPAPAGPAAPPQPVPPHRSGTGRPGAPLVITQPELFEASAAPVATAVAEPPARVAPTVGPTPPAPAPVPAPRARPAADVVPGLARLGLPETLCGSAGERDLRLVLADRLRTLPAAPPLPQSSGSVLAVVGDADRALGLAQDLARELGLEAGDVLLATTDGDTHRVPAWLLLDNRETAGERRRSWWRRDRLTLVAVDSRFGMSTGWARRMLDALEPTLTWGVIDATWKPEDVERWSDGLGGVDSFALQNVHATVSPAAILNVDVPVARLDGAVATPTVWSSLLAERLAA